MEKFGKKKRIWIILLVLLLIVGGFSLFFLRGCDGEKSDTDEVAEIPDIDIEEQEDTSVIEIIIFEDSLAVEGTDEFDTIVELVDTIVASENVIQQSEESKEKVDIAEKEKKRLEEIARQEQLRREAEEQRRLQEAVEDAERQRLEEEARLAAEEAERQRQIEEEEKRVMSEGILNGEFSVSSSLKVRFSQGNLQYQASTDTWRFALNQWDFEGLRNENIDPDNVGWIDLFGWGTSGYNKKYPFMISRHASDYVSGERNIANTKYDWGIHNSISNGGGKENLWRLLTHNEWRYLLCKRKNASKLFAFATVAGVKGLILLPDNWQKPAGAKLELSVNKGMKYIGDDEYINNEPKTSVYDHNILSINNWRILEENGAVFLPAAGGRDYANVFEEQVCGFYWSSTHIGTLEAYMVGFSAGNFVASDFELRSCGSSVRLVRTINK